jgi:hypothetical protein
MTTPKYLSPFILTKPVWFVRFVAIFSLLFFSFQPKFLRDSWDHVIHCIGETDTVGSFLSYQVLKACFVCALPERAHLLVSGALQ